MILSKNIRNPPYWGLKLMRFEPWYHTITGGLKIATLKKGVDLHKKIEIALCFMEKI